METAASEGKVIVCAVSFVASGCAQLGQSMLDPSQEGSLATSVICLEDLLWD